MKLSKIFLSALLLGSAAQTAQAMQKDYESQPGQPAPIAPAIIQPAHIVPVVHVIMQPPVQLAPQNNVPVQVAQPNIPMQVVQPIGQAPQPVGYISFHFALYGIAMKVFSSLGG